MDYANTFVRLSDELLQVEEGSLYPALHRMEQDQWISSKWEITNKGRQAKFYSITAKGRKQLAEENESWDAPDCGRDARVDVLVSAGFEICRGTGDGGTCFVTMHSARN